MDKISESEVSNSTLKKSYDKINRKYGTLIENHWECFKCICYKSEILQMQLENIPSG